MKYIEPSPVPVKPNPAAGLVVAAAAVPPSPPPKEKPPVAGVVPGLPRENPASKGLTCLKGFLFKGKECWLIP